MLDPQTLCQKCMTQLPGAGAPCPNCGTRRGDVVNLPHQLASGAILGGKYWVGAVLGQGGFGITYTGYDLNLGVKVAIKEYYPSGIVSRNQPDEQVLPVHDAYRSAYARGRERFLAEARSLARFSTERGVVNVREFFLANSTAYIVMEFVEGETLKAAANESGGKLSARRVLSLMRPLIDTLWRIHEAGLLHRDISPDNILLRPDGTAVLIDFGAARQISINGTHSLTINVKHGYAPEEQYRRRGKQGPWTDVYALCATIYRLTTGKKPPQALDRLVGNDSLVPPNERGADFTAAQQRALLKGLSIHAEDRPQGMRELYELLYGGHPGFGAVVSRVLDALVKPDTSGRIGQKQRRNAAIAICAAAFVALVSLALMLRAVTLRRELAVVSAAPSPVVAIEPAAEITPNLIIGNVSQPSAPAGTPAAAPTPTPDPVPTPQFPGYVTSNQLALRKRPTAEAGDIFDTLHNGDAVDLINKQNNYYFVWVPALDEYGYVLCKYIETTHDADIPHINTPAPATPVLTVTPEPTPTPGILQNHPGDEFSEYRPTLPPYAPVTPASEDSE